MRAFFVSKIPLFIPLKFQRAPNPLLFKGKSIIFEFMPINILNQIKRLSLALIMVLFSCSLALAADALISNIEVSDEASQRISFVVEGAFTEEIEEAIKSAIPTSFTFIIKMHRTRGYWFDKHIDTWEFNHTVRYDTLKQEYTVIFGEGSEEVKTSDFQDMKRLMSEVREASFPKDYELVSGKEYTLKVMAELDTVELPLYLHYMLFFVHIWDFETDWEDFAFTVK